jgi:hypothetical protein
MNCQRIQSDFCLVAEEKMGAKDALCKVATMNIGLEDTLAYYSPEELPGGTKSRGLCTIMHLSKYSGIIYTYIYIIYICYILCMYVQCLSII